MNRIIWKHPIPDIGRPGLFCIKTPGASETLRVAIQNGQPWLWETHLMPPGIAEGDPERFAHKAYYELAWTGTPMIFSEKYMMKYVGTFEMKTLVWHVFRVFINDKQFEDAQAKLYGRKPE